jgi:hypothetical protein
MLTGALEAGVQIFIDFWEWLKQKHQNLWGSSQWEKIVDEGAEKAKSGFSLVVDNVADACKKEIRELPAQYRKPAARFFASSIDLVGKFQTTVGKNIVILKDYICDFLESAWSMLKDIATRITETAEEIIESIRNIFSSTSRGDGDSGILLLPR